MDEWIQSSTLSITSLKTWLWDCPIEWEVQGAYNILHNLKTYPEYYSLMYCNRIVLKDTVFEGQLDFFKNDIDNAAGEIIVIEKFQWKGGDKHSRGGWTGIEGDV